MSFPGKIYIFYLELDINYQSFFPGFPEEFAQSTEFPQVKGKDLITNKI